MTYYNLIFLSLISFLLNDFRTIATFDDSNGFDDHLHHPDDDHHHHEPFDPVPYPDQEHCDSITARKLCGAGSSEGKWAVVKVSPLPKPLDKKFDLNVNFCSPFSYAPEFCREMLIRIKECKDDPDLTLQTIAYNNRTKSTVNFANHAKLIEKYYAIYQGNPIKMEEYSDDGCHVNVHPIPDVVLHTQGEAFAKVGKSDDDLWMIFQACESPIAWVVVRADLKAKDLCTYEKEYMAELDKLGVDTKCMVDVPIVDADGESFRYCLQNLDNIATSLVF